MYDGWELFLKEHRFVIKNFIFDMGNVLLKFEPETFVKRLALGAEDERILLDIVYGAQEWGLQDSGDLTEEEFMDLVRARLPEQLRKYVYPLVKEWDQPLIIVEGMEELIGELKGRGYGIFLLSNASTRQHEYWPRIPASKHFDGTLISADVKMVKPEPRIYECLFKTFSLKPEECFFIDDRAENIRAAEALGMRGFVFEYNPGALREKIRQAIGD